MKSIERIPKHAYFNDGLQFDASIKQISGYYAPHWHEFYEIEYILSGAGQYEINGKTFSFSPGSFFLMTPVDFHTVTVKGQAQIVNIMFSERWLDESLIYHLLRVSMPLVVTIPNTKKERFSLLYHTMIAEYAQSASFRETVIKNLLECAVIEMLRELHIPLENETNQKFTSMQRALLYIQNHFREPLTLQDAAKQAGLSITYFSEKFHEYAGNTFCNYVIRLRCEYAKKMLAYTDISVTEICYASGFTTLSHFQRTFKAICGKSPRAWRNASRTI